MSRKYKIVRRKKININRKFRISKIKIEAYKRFTSIDISITYQKFIYLRNTKSHNQFCPCQLCIWNFNYYTLGNGNILDRYIDNVKNEMANKNFL